MSMNPNELQAQFDALKAQFEALLARQPAQEPLPVPKTPEEQARDHINSALSQLAQNNAHERLGQALHALLELIIAVQEKVAAHSTEPVKQEPVTQPVQMTLPEENS